MKTKPEEIEKPTVEKESPVAATIGVPRWEMLSAAARTVTAAMQVHGGCVLRVTSPAGESLTFVPFNKIADDENGGKKLVASK